MPSVVRRRALRAVRIALAVVAVWFDVSGCSSPAHPPNTRPSGQSGRPSAAGPPPERFAYLTKGALTVHSGALDFGPVVGGFAETRVLFWTRSGAYAVAISTTAAREHSLVVIDARNGTVRRLPCGCTGAAPIGDDRIAYVDPGRGGQILDLARDAPPEPFALGLPTGVYPVEVMSSAGDLMLIRTRDAPEPSGDGADERRQDFLFALRPGAPPKQVHTNAFIVGSSATGGVGVDGVPGFLITGVSDDGECGNTFAWLYRADTGAKEPVRFDTGPGGARKDVQTSITDAWWAADGQLNATLTASVCADGVREPPTDPTLWRYDAGRWQQVDTTAAYAIRAIGPHARILLVLDDDDYALVVERDGNRSPVAREIVAIAAP